MGLLFIKGKQNPESKVAKLELLPKQPLQRASPTLQLEMAEPCTGRVTWMSPPVQPSQQPPSRTENGVYWVAMLQQGLTMLLGELMHTKGRERLQTVSPSKGLQLLQENLPAQLLQQEGQTVACMVSPFLMGWMLLTVKLDCACESTASNTAAKANRPFIANIIINKKILRTPHQTQTPLEFVTKNMTLFDSTTYGSHLSEFSVTGIMTLQISSRESKQGYLEFPLAPIEKKNH